MKKILILGGSHRDIPLINASKELGFFVITLGNRDYYLGHNYSDKSYLVNFNDLKKVKEIIEIEKIDYLLPGCGEESYLNTVRLSQELGIGNFDKLETALLVHNKWKFKEFCLKNNISTPKGKFYNSKKDLDNLDFPLVIKPTNLSGGRGVEVVNDINELRISLENTRKYSDEIFLEEFIQGQLIAYSIFIQDQKIIYDFLGEDKSYLNKYLISTAFPCKIKEVVLNKLKNDIEKLSKLLNLVDGMFHLQVLIKDNKPYIIDVTRRIPGDLYPYLIEYCDGIDYCKAVVKSYIKCEKNYRIRKNKDSKFVIRHCVMPNKNGIYKGLKISNTLKNKIIYKLDLLEKNSKISDFISTQLAIVFIKLDENDNEVIENLNNLVDVIID